ncbi:Pup--protein ligase [Corynebacterium renale]|uniref:Pup--protein ligase n=1 Tax=Corynebacterium renale TaxID=1724 RepID=A0A2A9DQT6_9CORY|nr:Pup--protein ligase [Corynebacterium renale]PFG28726.1 proteasome accessory factor A [Corynebacterium renale]SQI26027.1 proteasome component [Corynebacterium renale]
MSQAVLQRIMGIETEYGLVLRKPSASQQSGSGARRSGKGLSPDEVARYLFRPVVREYSSSNVFLPNGSRLYLDVGSHPEYATAECLTISDLLAQERAGDRLFTQLADTAEEALSADGFNGSIYLFKNNVDSAGNSYGCHENYLVSRHTSLKAFGRQLLPMLVTRQLIAGSGRILPTQGDEPARLVLSQRADHMLDGVSSATTRSRPMINTRDEPHADSSKYRRMHVIVGDSNIAQPTFVLKIGSALLTIEMLEAGWDLPDMELADPTRAIRDVSRDLTGRTPVELRDGSTMTALEIQMTLCEAAHDWLHERPTTGPGEYLHEELIYAADLWKRTLEAMEAGDMSPVETEIDWVIKKKLLDAYRLRGDLDWNDPRLREIDLRYHDIRPGRGLGTVLEQRGAIATWLSPDSVAHATENPPQHTRAAIRGKFLRTAREVGAMVNADWTTVKINRPEPTSVRLNDPFETDNTEVDTLIQTMVDHARETGPQQ